MGTSAGAHNLPLPLTSLIGRQDDVVGIVHALSRARLLTVVGPGGAGKTRLALAAAHEMAATRPDGAWLIDVTDAAEVEGLWARVATVIGLDPSGPPDLAARVVAHLRSRQLLLVLDNCERMRTGCAEVVSTVTRAGPGVSILCTSREPLGAPGEQVWPLAGLAVEGEDHPGPLGPAAHLFVERALARRPDLSLGPETIAVVDELCRRLDGLPLAVELAAARVGALSIEEILARLDDPLTLLVADRPGLPPRQLSLAATLDWSHGLLSDAEAVLFRRLAVFAESFTLAAAAAVCAAPPLQEADILELTTSLVDKSLVMADTARVESRYRILLTTRHYAATRLAAAEEAESLRQRHAEWVLRLVNEAADELRHAPAKHPLARLATDENNVEAALAWTVDRERADLALGIAAAMTPFWRRRQRYRTGTDWLTKALALPEQPARIRMEALRALGLLIGESGDRPGAIAPLEEARRLAEATGDSAAEGQALSLLGYFQLFVHMPTRALPTLERSTQKARSVGDRPTLLHSLSSAGWVAMFGGDARVAEARFRECLAGAHGDERSGVATWPALVGMGSATLAQGRCAEAETSLIEALVAAERMRSRPALAVVRCFLAELARTRGDFGAAGALVEPSLALARETGNPFAVAMRLALLGVLAHDQGLFDDAEEALVESVAVARAAALPLADARCRVALGDLRVSQGWEQQAAVLLDEGAAVATAHGLEGVVAAAHLARGRLQRHGDDLQAAVRSVTRAMQLQGRLGDVLGLVDAVEVLAGIRARQGRSRTAGRLFAAASRERAERGLVRPPVRVSGYEADLAVARKGLGPSPWEAAWAAGESMSLADVTAMAVRRQGRRDATTTGWEAITPAEREVVALVALGLTNQEVAARLVISSRTVETHVAHVLAKVGLTSRRELARVASAKRFTVSAE